MYVDIYIYIHMYTHIYIYTYIYIHTWRVGAEVGPAEPGATASSCRGGLPAGCL